MEPEAIWEGESAAQAWAPTIRVGLAPGPTRTALAVLAYVVDKCTQPFNRGNEKSAFQVLLKIAPGRSVIFSTSAASGDVLSRSIHRTRNTHKSSNHRYNLSAHTPRQGLRRDRNLATPGRIRGIGISGTSPFGYAAMLLALACSNHSQPSVHADAMLTERLRHHATGRSRSW